MPRFRCDFAVAADLVLPSAEQELAINLRSGVSISLQNGPVDGDGNAASLVAVVVGDAPCIDEAEASLRPILAQQLDLLCLVTQSRFTISGLRRIVDWEPRQQERTVVTVTTWDARYPPEPSLAQKFADTCEALESMDPPAFVRKALHHFRLGCLERDSEDQFMRYWLALEIVAENTKPNSPVPIECEQCGKGAKCAHCNHEPTRLPMAKDAIHLVINRVVGNNGSEVAKRLLAARHALMHGRGEEYLEKITTVPLAQIVNELAVITDDAIKAVIIEGQNVHDLTFGDAGGDFQNLVGILRAPVHFNHKLDADQPTEKEIPDVKVSVQHRFGEPKS